MLLKSTFYFLAQIGFNDIKTISNFFCIVFHLNGDNLEEENRMENENPSKIYIPDEIIPHTPEFKKQPYVSDLKNVPAIP